MPEIMTGKRDETAEKQDEMGMKFLKLLLIKKLALLKSNSYRLSYINYILLEKKRK
jgi:hypothetical protein